MPDQITIPDAAVEAIAEQLYLLDYDGEKPWSAFPADSYHRQRYREKARKLQAALPRILPTGEGVKVKALEWATNGNDEWIARSILGRYLIFSEGDPTFVFNKREFATLGEAKAAAQADYDQRISSALVPIPPTEAVKPVAWRCFHCDEVFTDRSVAEDHFGLSEQQLPACVIKAGAERSLVRALRNAEQAASEAMFALHNETSDAAKAYFAQTARHNTALQAAEEAGYERGLTNARPDPLPPTEAVKPEPVAWKTPYFEKLINGSLAPILVWGGTKKGDDWIALYAAPPPAADVAELMEATHRLLALCKAGGDPYGEPGKPHVIAVEQALASLRSKGGGDGQ